MTTGLSVAALDGTHANLSPADLEQLRSRHRGPCLVPGDADYDAAILIWNAMIEARPSLVLQPTGTADVVEAVSFARQRGLLTSIKGGGHNVAGNALVDGGLTLDLARLRHVSVDPAARRAWVGGGCTLADVDRETQVHGLAAPLGAVSETGVAGLTLGGGYGWLRSRHGLACDAVRTFEVVTAAGEVVRASEENNADLYWALRGGGGNFGVVTGFEFELYPVGPEVLLVGAAYPIERTAEVMRAWRDFDATAPPELATNVLQWTLADSDAFPPEGRGQEVALIGGCWSGPLEEGLERVRPLRELGPLVMDLTGPVTWCEQQQAFDPFFRKGERRNYWKSVYIDRLPDELIDRIAARALERPDPWTLLNTFPQRDALAREPRGGAAIGNREAPWVISIDTSWTDPGRDEACRAWTREVWQEFAAYSSTGGSYLNFHAGAAEDVETVLRASFGDEKFERLRGVKARWDPENFFRVNPNVAPVPAAGRP